MYEQTIKERASILGVDIYGGNKVLLTLDTAPPGSGISFITPKGVVKAEIGNAYPSHNSIMLRSGGASVLHVEHLLATLYAYGIDNATVTVERKPGFSYYTMNRFGIATDIEVVPTFPNREKELCDLLDSAGAVKQSRLRNYLSIDNKCGEEGLFFEPNDKLVFESKTQYDQQTVISEINAGNYREELARSRPYARHMPWWAPAWLANLVCMVAYPHFGLSHALTSEYFLFPKQCPRLPNEVNRHSIVDRLGAVALLHGRLTSLIRIDRTGHARDIAIIKRLLSNRCIY